MKSLCKRHFERVFCSTFNVNANAVQQHYALRLILDLLLFHGWKGQATFNVIYIDHLISVSSSLNHARHLIAYTVNNQHVFKSDVLPKRMTDIFYSQFAQFAYDLHVCKLWNTVRWQEPAFDKASDIRVVHLSLWYETLQNRAQWNINSLVVKYVQIWNRILPQNI